MSAGVDYLQQDGGTSMTGGAATGDFDGDGLPDLFVTRGDDHDLMFRNKGDGSFEDVTAATGLDAFDLPSNGAAFVDVDNDGDADLYVTTWEGARFYLFINDGSGNYTEEGVARAAAIDTGWTHYGTSVNVGDYDGDGWVDLHTTEWRLDSQVPVNALAHVRLLRNRGAEAPGFFQDVTQAAGVAYDDVPSARPEPGTWGFSSAFVDLDHDGWTDLAVTADFNSSRIFWNDGDGTFTDGTAASMLATERNGMGFSLGDYDGDGLFDWLVTSVFDVAIPVKDGNRLFRNTGGRVFSDETDAAGVRNGYWGWGAVLFDYDNDGDLDIAHTNGWTNGTFDNDPMRLWNNSSSVFSDESADLIPLDTRPGRGLLTFDYDQDGDLDVFVVNNREHPALYRNDGGNDNDWLRVRVVGTQSSREGYGAKVSVVKTLGDDPQVRQIGVSSHYLGQSERIAHFGLGTDAGPVASVLVEWPSGYQHEYTEVPRNQVLTAVEAFPVPALPWGIWPVAALLLLGCALRTLRPRPS